MGGGVKVIKRFVPFIEPGPEDMSLSRKGDTMTCLQKWYHHNQEENIRIYEDQKLLMGDV